VVTAATARAATSPAHLRRAVENIDIARIFAEIADLLEIRASISSESVPIAPRLPNPSATRSR
jgi:hypothetical protein